MCTKFMQVCWWDDRWSMDHARTTLSSSLLPFTPAWETSVRPHNKPLYEGRPPSHSFTFSHIQPHSHSPIATNRTFTTSPIARLRFRSAEEIASEAACGTWTATITHAIARSKACVHRTERAQEFPLPDWRLCICLQVMHVHSFRIRLSHSKLI